jgi:hypothetical protein
VPEDDPPKPDVRFDYRGGDANETWPFVQVPSGAERIQVQGVPEGVYDVSIRARPYAPVVLRGVRIVAGKTTDVGKIHLKRGSRLTVVLSDHEGDPVEKWCVVALCPGNPVRWASTKEDGQARTSGLLAGEYLVLGLPWGRPVRLLGRISLDGKEDRTLEVRLPAAGSIRVRLGEAGIPVEVVADAPAPLDRLLPNGLRTGWVLSAPDVPEQPWKTVPRETDPDGEVTIGPLEPGGYFVRVGSRRTRVIVPAGETVEVDLTGR